MMAYQPPGSRSIHALFKPPYVLACLLLITGMADNASAADDYWNVLAGDWFVDVNWLDGSVPDKDFAYIDNGGVAYVGASPSLAGSFGLWVGDSATGYLVVHSGGQAGGSFASFFGNNAGSYGSVNIMDMGSLYTTGASHIGVDGNASVNISGGAGYATAGANLGENAGSFGWLTVDGTGSAFVAGAYIGEGSIYVGQGGSGRLDISNGGHVSGATTIGDASGSSGTVTVDGAGSDLSSRSYLIVGFEGGSTGSLTITNGGEVTAGLVGSSGFFKVGAGAGSNGSVFIDGYGSRLGVEFDETSPYYLILGDGGTGSLTVRNSGRFDFFGNDPVVLAAATGSAGTLNIGSGGAPGVVNVASVFGGAGTASLNFNHNNADYYFTRDSTSTGSAVAITGSTAVNQLGSGKTTLLADNTYTGGTTISAGTLQIGNGGTTGSITGNILNNSALVFDRSDALTYAGDISGTGSLTQQGTGSLNLTGSNSYSGATSVDAGTLLVNGSISNSATTVNAGATLGGNGTVGSVTLAGGSFAPGNSIGTTTVSGDVDFSGGGVYQVEVDAAGNSDLIDASGTATLGGGSVQVLPEAGTYLFSTDYTILSAAGGLSGTFDSVSSNLAFLDPTLSYDANNVYLNLLRNDVSFSAVAATPNQIAVADVLTQLAASNPDAVVDILNNLVVLTNTGAQQAYDSLSGVQHTVNPLLYGRLMSRFMQLLFDYRGSGFTNHQVAFNALQGLQLADNSDNLTLAAASVVDARSPTLTPVERGWWLRGFGGKGDFDSTRLVRGADYRQHGIAFGVDHQWRDNWVIGLAGSYSTTDVNGHTSDFDTDSYQVAAYADWQSADVYVDATIAAARHDTDASRQVNVGMLTSTASSNYDSATWGFALEAGKDYHLAAATTLTPFAGIEYSHTQRDDFTETGAGLSSLNVDDENYESLRTRLGIRLSRDTRTTGGTAIRPSLYAAYVHEHGDNEGEMTAAFGFSPATPIDLVGIETDRDRLQLGVGVAAQINQTMQLSFNYDGEFSGSDDHHALAATLRVLW